MTTKGLQALCFGFLILLSGMDVSDAFLSFHSPPLGSLRRSDDGPLSSSFFLHRRRHSMDAKKKKITANQTQRPVDRLLLSSLPELLEEERNDDTWKEKFLRMFSQTFNAEKLYLVPNDRRRIQWVTLFRVGVPSVITGVLATITFPALALFLAGLWNTNPGTLAVLSQDSSQFVQNFLTVAGLLFSILVGQTYYFLYTQQESLYYALFQEVTEAKSLLEQVALVCQGRSMYQKCLLSIYTYVQNDLKRINSDPAVLLSARPVDDPLEAIMYMTSVGIPSSVYETVKSLRAARAQRLGALQRKLPNIHMWLLWTLAAIELVSFPLLGAGTQTIGGYNILTVEGILFGVMTSGIVLTLRVVGELWRPAGGAYNVDAALSTMVLGLEKELQARVAGRKIASQSAPSGARDTL